MTKFFAIVSIACAALAAYGVSQSGLTYQTLPALLTLVVVAALGATCMIVSIKRG
jgi:energy-converting hydrogenase Eha subunit E